MGGVQYAPRWLYGALKKTLEAPYTTKVNNRETTSAAVELNWWN